MKWLLKVITKQEILKIFLIFSIWRLSLLGFSILADNFYKYAPSFPYADTLLATFSIPRYLYSWANFDGVHYLTIAREGYTRVQFIQAFFPLFPGLILRPISIVSQGQINILAVGLLLTQIFALGACLSWFAFIKHFFNSKFAWLTLLILLLFPTSLFLGALYTEGLFLTLVFSAFILASKKHWGWASLLASLASATRVIGVFLVPALLLELYLTQTNAPRWTLPSFKSFLQNNVGKIIQILLGSLGLLGYMLYLQIQFSDPLAFFHSQSAFGAGRQTSLVIYPQVVFRALKILLTSPLDLKYLAYTQEFLAGTLGFLGIILGSKYSRPSWILFAVLAFLLPTSTGTFSSMGRYILVCFPLFIIIGKKLENKPMTKWLWLVVSGLLLLLNTILFIQGYWVA